MSKYFDRDFFKFFFRFIAILSISIVIIIATRIYQDGLSGFDNTSAVINSFNK